MRVAVLVAVVGSLISAINTEALAEKQVALVIGNSNYANAAKLPNPVNDATAVSVMLESAGFTVVETRNDLGNSEMRRVIRNFSDQAQDADVAVVYYAGHGMEVDGTNFLIPTDAKLERDIDVEDEAIALDRVLKMIEPARRLRLVILDACRDNPFTRTMKRTMMTRSVGRGLARVEPSMSDTLIAFAAKAGSTASDGDGANSPFTSAVVRHIVVPGLDLRIAFGNVRDDVLKSTSNRQEPFVYGSLGGGTIALVRATASRDDQAAAPAPDPVPGATTTGNDAWHDYELAAQVGTMEVWDSFLRLHTTGFYANLARAQRAKLLAAVPPPAAPLAPAAVAPAPAPAMAAVPPETSTRSLSSPEREQPSTKKKRVREREREREPSKRAAKRARGGGGSTICGRVRSAVRAATAAGLDNGVGIISAARAQCGG